MPARRNILEALTGERRQELETVFRLLQAEGFTLTVHADGDESPPDGLGYAINVDRPGSHARARLRVDVDDRDWSIQLLRLHLRA